MNVKCLLLLTFLLALFKHVNSVGLWCYSCYHGQPGCGDYVDWEVQRERSEWCWEQCVKFVDDTGGQRKVYRGCLTTMMKKTYFREKMPGLRRHGYCLPARSHDTSLKKTDPLSFVLETKQQFCFCDEYIFCNSGHKIVFSHWSLLAVLGTSLFSVLANFF